MKPRFRKVYLSFTLTVLAAFILAAGSIIVSGQEALAGDFPSKPMKLVVPWPPGGGTDRSARVFAPYLGKELGVPVTVMNISGGGGWMAWGKMTRWRAPKDEHMLGIVNVPNVLSFLDPRLKRTETLDSFGWLTLHTLDPCIWLVRRDDARFQTLHEFLEYGEKHPNELTIMVSGVGGDDHLGVAAAEKLIPGFKTKKIHTNTCAKKLAACMGKTADAIGDNVAYYIHYVMEGNLTTLCILNDKRVKEMPNVPTFEELTGKRVISYAARFLVGPPNLSEEKRQILLGAIKKAFNNPEYVMSTMKSGDKVVFKTGEELRKALEEAKDLALSVKYWELEMK
jgi:tripartite-type tricarboxylate transporter receptor subunit TctC